MSDAQLLGPAEVRELAARLDVSPTKKLGQNFVHDPNTVRKIVRLAGVTADDNVLEIGPGLGSLTLGLLAEGATVTAVEIDERLAGELPATAARKVPASKIDVILKDALLLSADDFAGRPLPDTLVANLPYNVSVPILMHLLDLLSSLNKGLVMVQSEVGERVAAKPGSKEYGAPSVKAAWYGDWAVASKVSRQIFWPVPGVDSVLVSYVKRSAPLADESFKDKTFALINAAFGGRRKMLRQSLQEKLGVKSSGEAEEILGRAGVDATARAESLTVHDFLRIAQVLV